MSVCTICFVSGVVDASGQSRSEVAELWAKLRKVEDSQTEIRKTQTQHEQKQTQLEKTQTQHEQKQTQLEKTQTQHEQTQTQLEQKQTQLEKTQKKLKKQNKITQQKHSKAIQDLGTQVNGDIKEVRLPC